MTQRDVENPWTLFTARSALREWAKTQPPEVRRAAEIVACALEQCGQFEWDRMRQRMLAEDVALARSDLELRANGEEGNGK